jgi:anti-sigma B factor antagonist
MQTGTTELFHVYKNGRLTVIGFEGRHLEDPDAAELIRERLLGLVDRNDCEVLVVDLLDVQLISSWILGVLASVGSHKIAVELYHPSPEICGVLDMTHLDRVLHVRDAIG